MILAYLRRMFAAPESVLPEVRVFSAPAGMRVYAVGDIHGQSRLLTRMLAAIARDAAEHPAEKTVQIFLGDYIDRGLHSREVIDQLIARPPSGHERICLMGNHEEALLGFLDDPTTLRGWANFGGYATLASYGVDIPKSMSPATLVELRDRFRQNLPVAHMAFLKNLQLTYALGDYRFVHAGVMPGIPWEKQKREHLLWIRDPFLHHAGFFEHYIVHGHSPVRVPEIFPHRANLDVSAAEKPSLCCLVIEGEQRRAIVVTDEKD